MAKRKCKFGEPCKKFRDFIDEKFLYCWSGVNPAVLGMVKEDIKKWFEFYHEQNGCFYDE
jgi:hypothetical protein